MTADAGRRPASRRGGFSLIELMIAVMILGLGMVMVATVFPVSLDMTRETLQMHIANAAVETAVETLRLRVPGLHEDLDGVSGAGIFPEPRLLFPNVLNRPEFYGQMEGMENDAELQNEASFFTMWPTIYDRPWPKGPLYSPTTANTPTETALTRTFTELTFWDADVPGNPSGAGTTWVLPSETIPPNYGLIALDTSDPTGGVMVDRPPYIDVGLGAAPVPWVRLHLADRVYPPVPIESRNGFWVDPRTNLPFASERDMNVYVARTAAERRYAWHVIHARSATYLTNHSFLCTILVTHRADLNARYARQGPLSGPRLVPLVFPHTGAATSQGLPSPLILTTQELLLPQAAADTEDSLFPQAWLVAFNNISPSTGLVQCTNLVANMLPAGSFFVIAQDPQAFFGLNMEPPAGFEAGTPHKVIGNDWQPAQVNAPATLKIARSTALDTGPVAVWVFPPPIEKRSGALIRFQSRSPVVGAFVREVRPG